jgi:hypothetical protein
MLVDWHSKALMLRCSCFAQLQLEVAKRIVTAVRKVAPKHNQSCEKFLHCAELQLDI